MKLHQSHTFAQIHKNQIDNNIMKLQVPQTPTFIQDQNPDYDYQTIDLPKKAIQKLPDHKTTNFPAPKNFGQLKIFDRPASNNNKLQIWPIKMDRAVRRKWMLAKLEQRYAASEAKRLKFVDESDKNERKKREIKEVDEESKQGNQDSTPKNCTKRMENVENLLYIREYLQTANECLEYLRKIGDMNAK
jgi:hypothetical protein